MPFVPRGAIIGLVTTTDTQLEVCAACGVGFPTITEVFSHPCPGLKITRIGLGESPASRPQGTGTGSGAPTTSSGPTDKQVAFIARLAAERGVEVPEATTKAQASTAIERLLAQPVARTASPSVRSNRYAGSCGHCRATVAEGEGRIENLAGRWVTYHLDGACPAAAPEAAPKVKPSERVTEDGFYLNPANDEVFKVQIAHHGSGGLYAKRLVLPTDETERGSWAYEAGLIGRIDPAWKLTLEAAQAWGRLYGYCCRCGTVLTDEDSIAQGIGPVCATKV